MYRLLGLAACLLTAVLGAQLPLELKGFRGGQPAGPHRHIIVQFNRQPAPEALQLLRSRGASILEYIPRFGYVLSTPGDLALDGLDLRWSGSLAAGEKVSVAFKEHPGSRTLFAVVEFYSDVAMSHARTIVTAARLRIHDNPDLLNHNLLVSGSPSALRLLAKSDEVEYIFPASDDLIQGRSVNACPGALTDQGLAGQSIQKMGSWGPVGESVNLQYAFDKVTSKLAAGTAESEIERALITWSKYVQVNWTQTTELTADRTLTILFARGAHGDGYPFDGSGGVVAHTFYPYPTNSESIAGDMHFDEDENWHVGANTDLFSIALHEAGHALGLGHSDQPGAVMYPYYHQVTDLSAEDVAVIQTLYLAQEPAVRPSPLMLTITNPEATTSSSSISLSGSTAGGVAPVMVTWETDSNFSGTATNSNYWLISQIPLHPGSNEITVTAVDAQKTAVLKTVTVTYTDSVPGPSLVISSPVSTGIYTTTRENVVLTGSAGYERGIAQVTWTASSGLTGIATGTTHWTSGEIPLSTAATQITVTALTADGKTASQTLTVDLIPPDAPPSGPTTLTILNPAVVTLTVTTDTLPVSGTSSSGLGIASVTWGTSNGDSGTAIGTTQWTIAGVPLLPGTNTILITANDTSGASSWRSLVVTRY